MFPIDLLLVVVIGYAAAVLFFFAHTPGARPRSIVFVLPGVVVLGGAPDQRTNSTLRE